MIKGMAALAALVLAGNAQAATLLHSYEFNGTAVTDSTGNLDGALGGGATVSGGTLNLDGANDFAMLGGKALDLTAAHSVYLRYSATGQNKELAEMVSQGFSGQPGFYIGTGGGRQEIRLTDYRRDSIGVVLPQDGTFHDLLYTTGNGTSLYIDGTLVFSAAENFTAGNNAGFDTLFGNQFGNQFNEYFAGRIDRALFFDGVATYAEAIGSVPGGVPEPATWAMMIGGFGVVGGAVRRRPTAKVSFA